MTAQPRPSVSPTSRARRKRGRGQFSLAQRFYERRNGRSVAQWAEIIRGICAMAQVSIPPATNGVHALRDRAGLIWSISIGPAPTALVGADVLVEPFGNFFGRGTGN